MPYRSTKEKFKAQKVARKLYVEDKLSLEEISQQTGETLRTLRAWHNLGDWENRREAETKTDLDRLRSLRDSLLDKAEAQIKAEKLPHTEIGLMYRLERLIAQREKREEMVDTVAVNTIKHLGNYLIEHDPELARSLVDHLMEFSKWVLEQDLTRSPQEPTRVLK